MLIYLLGVHSWYKLAHLWLSWDFSPPQIRKQAEQCGGGRTPELETIGSVCTEETESGQKV